MERMRLSKRLSYHANRVELDKLKKSVADGVKLNDDEHTRLGALQSAKNRNMKLLY